MIPHLQALRAEYAQEGLSSLLYGTIQRAVKAVVWSRRIPSWRSLDGKWDADAFTALTDDLLVDALTPARLRYLLDVCDSMVPFESEVERVILDYLRRHAKRGRIGNLQEQVIRILHARSAFAPFSTGGRRSDWVWGLSAWAGVLPPDADGARADEAVGLLRTFSRPRYGGEAQKRPPALASEDLERFLLVLFQSTRSGWVVKEIVRLVADTLGLLGEEGAIPVQDVSILGHSKGENGEDAVEGLEARNDALGFYRSCTELEQAILNSLAHGVRSLDEVAESVGVSKPTVSRHTRAMVERLRSMCQGDSSWLLRVWDEVMAVTLNNKREEDS